MASILPDEGLDFILGQFPRSTAKYTSPLQCGLFKSQTNTTVIAYNGALASITASTYTSYAAQGLAAATWGAISELNLPTANLGRQNIYPQISFPAVGATGDTINGFYIADNGFTVCIGQANFDDGLADVLATGDILRLTPLFALKH